MHYNYPDFDADKIKLSNFGGINLGVSKSPLKFVMIKNELGRIVW